MSFSVFSSGKTTIWKTRGREGFLHEPAFQRFAIEVESALTETRPTLDRKWLLTGIASATAFVTKYFISLTSIE